MVTAELAVALPALVLVLVVALSAVTTVLDQVRCVDAARATARALARGEASGAAVGEGQRLGPPGAVFAVSSSAGSVEVTVTSRAAPALAMAGCPRLAERPCGRRPGRRPGRCGGRAVSAATAARTVRRRGERGSGTVLALAATGALLILLVAGLALASAVAATHRARAGADLAALAAASAVQAGATSSQACQRAAAVSASNAARQSECAVQADGSVTVGVTAPVGLPWPGTPSGARATARAGPAPSL